MVQASTETPSGGGIVVENVRSQLRPDLDGDGDGQPPAGRSPVSPAPETPATGDNIALDPRIIKFSVGALGTAVAEITRYPGWRFSDEELQAISDALAELGVRLPPLANALLVVVAIVAGKATAYVMWVRAGRPPIAESTRRLLEGAPASSQPQMPEPQQ